MHFNGYTRKYNADIPKFMRDKPRKFVNHMRERMTAAAEIRSSAVRAINEESGVFQVKGRGKDTWYQLNFSGSSPSQLPQCQCFDWAQNLLPCKHFIAVMREYPEWNWARFPESYRESPFITLDHVIVAKILPSVEN